MNIIFIVLSVLMLCGVFFALGHEIASDKHVKENFEMLDKLTLDDEERKLNNEKRKVYKDLSKQTYVCLFLSILLIMLILVPNIWDYRHKGMEDLKKGKYGSEEIVRIKTKGNEVKADTTYNFYRIKTEKK